MNHDDEDYDDDDYANDDDYDNDDDGDDGVLGDCIQRDWAPARHKVQSSGEELHQLERKF